MSRLQILRVLVASLVVAGMIPLGHATWMLAKAELAQRLIDSAWQQNLASGTASQRPWSWADTAPVARLLFKRQRERLTVLSGDSGRILAFGPGHRMTTPLPGRGGNSVISGHRDTHFSLLGDLRPLDTIAVETLEGRTVHYRVDEKRVVHRRDVGVTADRGQDELTLVTCWPLNTLTTGGPMRLVVSAIRVPMAQTQ